jgi:hypothetical protein
MLSGGDGSFASFITLAAASYSLLIGTQKQGLVGLIVSALYAQSKEPYSGCACRRKSAAPPTNEPLQHCRVNLLAAKATKRFARHGAAAVNIHVSRRNINLLYLLFDIV